MLDRSTLVIVAVAILGAMLGLLAGGWYERRPEVAVPTGVTVLQPGDQRVDLQLPDADGKPRRLSEWDGQVVLVNFWATWCGPCRQEMPLLDRAAANWAEKGLRVVGVAIDNPEAVREYLKDSPVSYPVLVDSSNGPDSSLIFGDTRSVLPFSVLLDRNGRIVERRAGSFSQSGLASWLAPHL